MCIVLAQGMFYFSVSLVYTSNEIPLSSALPVGLSRGGGGGGGGGRGWHVRLVRILSLTYPPFYLVVYLVTLSCVICLCSFCLCWLFPLSFSPHVCFESVYVCVSLSLSPSLSPSLFLSRPCFCSTSGVRSSNRLQTC